MIDNLHSIPRELVELPNWVCWGVEIETPKKPHNPRDLTPAKAGAPSTWGSFEQAVTCATEGKAQGVGFEFDGSSFVGVDLDHCLNAETGEITHWASEIVQSLDSYTEISMSGTGLHIFIKGQKPGKQCKKVLNKETGEAVEIYDNGRYFAMTGRIFNETSIVERTAELGIIYERLFSIEESAHNSVDIPSGLQVGLKRDRKLIAIWNGQRDSTDESGNDMSLMNMDKRGVSVLFVHHTSKAKDKDDPFNEISGTNGISGAVDTMFVLKKGSRHAREATLHITGRDIEQDELVIRLNEENCQWEFVGDADELARQEALSEYQISPIVKTIRAVLNESAGKRWSGSAKNLIEAGERIFKIPIAPSSQSLSSKLKGIKDLLNEQDKIVYTISPNGNAGYRHHFHYIVEVENPIVATDHDDEAVNFLN